MILAIDPGPTESAFLVLMRGAVWDKGKGPNADLLERVQTASLAFPLAIEMVESFGMPVGREVFETVYWIGRFAQAAHPRPHALVPRGEVKLHLCGSKRAKDSNIRAALLDRFGGKEAAVGRKAAPGPLYGIHGDCWSALAVAVTWTDLYAGAARTGHQVPEESPNGARGMPGTGSGRSARHGLARGSS